MNRITLTLSAEVIEAIDALAARLNATRAEVISFYLEGSTYLQKNAYLRNNMSYLRYWSFPAPYFLL